MQSSKTIFCALALLVIASCNAKPMPAARVPACTSTTEPGTVCRGRVNGAPQRCVQPILPTSAQCPAGLLQLLAQIVNVASASPADTCAETPCCDAAPGQPVECATVAVGCIADLKLCVGGGVGTLLKQLLGPLDVQLATVNLPITVGGAAGGVVGAVTGAAGK